MKRWNPDQPELVEREHDLPPSWDGVEVRWGPWEPGLVAFTCPPRKGDRECSRCGSVDLQPTSRGRLYGTTSDWLLAFRCPACGLDTVVGGPGGGTWVLDASDYGDAGSVAP